jgi:3-hydroxy acid dehydrogenase/malonic semialdehyde reductase
VYKNTTPLSKEDIANAIFSLAELPAHINVNRIEIMPTVQSYAGLSVERN